MTSQKKIRAARDRLGSDVERPEPRHICGIVGPYSRQVPLLERYGLVNPNGWVVERKWRVWTDYNPDLTAGTYLSLEPDGMVLAVTVLESGEITNTVVVMP